MAMVRLSQIQVLVNCLLDLLISNLQKLFLFFFSSRRRHTRSTRDWSSDVCSSDLPPTRRGSAKSTAGHSFQSLSTIWRPPQCPQREQDRPPRGLPRNPAATCDSPPD